MPSHKPSICLFRTGDWAYYCTSNNGFAYKWWCSKTYRFYEQPCSMGELQNAFDTQRLWYDYENCVAVGLKNVPVVEGMDDE